MNLKEFISSTIPTKQTNVLWQLFNNTKSALEYLNTKIDILKRERNIMTATSNIALRNLAAQNGIEPTLKIASKGILTIKINTECFNRNGYPLFLTPYTKFRNKINKVEYYYDGNTTIKLTNDICMIPVSEGILETTQHRCIGNDLIEMVYLPTDAIVDKSITIKSDKKLYTEVKSFYNNINEYDNNQFIVKHSISLNNPLILYIKGASKDEVLTISYRMCNGENGNINYITDFEIDRLIDTAGNVVELQDTDYKCINYKGFEFGSNGTTTNTLRSAIGYNHGSSTLYDNESYRNFLGKFSNILIQKINVDNSKKSINHIYVSKVVNLNSIPKHFLKFEYNRVINNKLYQFSTDEIESLRKIIEENEFTLSSHTLNQSIINRFAIQLIFDNIYDKDKYGVILETMIYDEFQKFMYDKHHKINFEYIFQQFMDNNKCMFEYNLFSEDKQGLNDTKIIQHNNYIPILQGDFLIHNNIGDTFRIMESVNIAIKK